MQKKNTKTVFNYEHEMQLPGNSPIYAHQLHTHTHTHIGWFSVCPVLLHLCVPAYAITSRKTLCAHLFKHVHFFQDDNSIRFVPLITHLALCVCARFASRSTHSSTHSSLRALALHIANDDERALCVLSNLLCN